MIPDEAVEAAVAAYLTEYNYNAEEIVRIVLEAAAPHMVAAEYDRGWADGSDYTTNDLRGVG